MAAAKSTPALAREVWRALFALLIRSAPARTGSLARRGLTPNDSRALFSLEARSGRPMRSLADEWRCDPLVRHLARGPARDDGIGAPAGRGGGSPNQAGAADAQGREDADRADARVSPAAAGNRRARARRSRSVVPHPRTPCAASRRAAAVSARGRTRGLQHEVHEAHEDDEVGTALRAARIEEQHRSQALESCMGL